MNELNPGPLPVIVGLLGVGLLTGGIWWIYRPAALIFLGLLLMTLAFFGRRGGA